MPYTELSEAQVEQFVATGIVTVKSAIPKAVAQQWVADAFGRLGYDPNRPSTWVEPFGRAPKTDEEEVRVLAPRAWAAIEDLLGGPGRVDQQAWRGGAGAGAVWPNDLAGNFGSAAERAAGAESWVAPGDADAQGVPLGGWHIDGGHFRHFLDSPEQGLLTVVAWTDIRERSGGTFVALDSIGPVAKLLASQPEGLHPDGVMGSGYLIPGLLRECQQLTELTADQGDVILMHPLVLHRVSGNPSGVARFIANPTVRLTTPLDLNRPCVDDNSPVERAILRGLGREHFVFVPARPRREVPFGGGLPSVRSPAQRVQELAELEVSMSTGLTQLLWNFFLLNCFRHGTIDWLHPLFLCRRRRRDCRGRA